MAHAQLRTEVVATGLCNPLAFVVDPGDPSTFYVVEQRGTIRTVRNNIVSPAMFLDIRSAISSGGERGLLGLAFPPDAAIAAVLRQLHEPRRPHRGRAVHPRCAGRGDPGSRFDLLWPDGRRVHRQPFSNHNGGHLAFGPDGYLYIGMGDGGSGGDPLNNAQNPNTLLGKMLRIDVNVPDNDPRGIACRKTIRSSIASRLPRSTEIWAFGLRNPWRYSFDDWTHGGTGALVIADVGQTAREEVNWEPRGTGGRNYGWRLREGRATYDTRTAGRVSAAHRTDSRLPAQRRHVDHRRLRLSRRRAAPDVQRPLFLRRLRRRPRLLIGLALDEQQEATAVDLLELTELLGGTSELGLISSFGVDADGELYLVSYSRGRILKIVP